MNADVVRDLHTVDRPAYLLEIFQLIIAKT